MPSKKARLFITDEADQNIADTYSWYEDQQVGLGDRFREVLRGKLDVVTSNPLLYQNVHGSIRRCKLSPFPYGIYFRVKSNEVRVLSVVGFKRHPKRWKGG